VPRQYTMLRDVRVPMRDGVELATDVYVPGGAGPCPTVLQRTPYDRTDPFGTQFICQMTVVRALDAGFAVVLQDTRGRFGSKGTFDPFVHEGADGEDTVAWIRTQDFSDGRVVSNGASYVGATQMLLAMQGAEGHVAMAPFLTTGDYHQHWTYRDGALQLGLVYLWITEALGPADMVTRQLPVDHPAQRTLRGLLGDPRGAMGRLPLLSDELVELAPYLADWLGNPTPGPWWTARTPLEHAEDIRTPALHIAGFNDVFLDGSLRSYQTLRRDGATPEVRDGQYLVIGPWSHGNIGDWQGDQWHGYDAAAPAMDLTGMQLEFFTAVLAGRRPELPRVRYFTSGVNEWRTADEWPPPAVETVLHLASEGRLTATPEDTGGGDQYVSDTLDPVPTTGGATFLPGILVNRNDGPKSQEAVEARADVLVYRSDVLTEPVEVTGPVTLELWASSSATDCDWTARLTDVDESERSIGIVDGILRARYRSGSQPRALRPSEVECFRIELGATSHVFAAGHRVGLQIASSNFPRFDRNPQQMVEPVRATADDFVVAEQTVVRGGANPSRLLLPVLLRSEDQG
jgi:uncharacterized protein